MIATVKPEADFIIECYDWTGGFIKNNDSADDVRDNPGASDPSGGISGIKGGVAMPLSPDR